MIDVKRTVKLLSGKFNNRFFISKCKIFYFIDVIEEIKARKREK